MRLTICDGPTENVIKPARHYADIAAACRAMGMDIADDDYETIDTLRESNSMWTTTPANDASSPIDFLVAGYLPHAGGAYRESLAN